MKKIIVAGLVFLTGAVQADWSGTASLGASFATGNSEAQSISGSLRLNKRHDKWEHTVFGDIFKGNATVITEQADGTIEISTLDTSDRIGIGYQGKFYWREKTYFFGLLDWDKDVPSDIDSRTAQIVGVGHQFWANGTDSFTAEFGVGAKQTDLVSSDEDLSEGVTYIAAQYLNRLNDQATLNADFRSDIGAENTATLLGLGISYKLSDRMALKLSYLMRNNSDIEGALGEKRDTVAGFSLVSDL